MFGVRTFVRRLARDLLVENVEIGDEYGPESELCVPCLFLFAATCFPSVSIQAKQRTGTAIHIDFP
jgi:hypothetical protein